MQKNKTKTIQINDPWNIIFLIIFLACITYLPFIRKQFFYRDDWYMIWAGYTQGVHAIIEEFSVDRPFLGLIYAANYLLLGNNPLAWNLYALFLRLSGAFAFLWLLRIIWPDKKKFTSLAVIIFLIYPGFLQQPNANTYTNILLSLCFAISSLACTLKVMKANNKKIKLVFSLLAIAMTSLYLLIAEYFIGVEAVRFILICYHIYQKDRKIQKSDFLLIIRNWIPYLITTFVFLTWRLFFFTSARPIMDTRILVNQYLNAPFEMVLRLGVDLIKDVFETLIIGWFVPFYQLTWNSSARQWIMSLVLSLVALVVTHLLLGMKLTMNDKIKDDHFSSDAMWIGLICTLVTLFPIIITTRDVRFSMQFDRYTLQAVPGVSIAISGFIAYLSSKKISHIFTSVLILIGVITHYHNALEFSRLGEYQRQLWWQLSWRAPDLRDQTTLAVLLPQGYRLEEGYYVWSPANMIYNPFSDGIRITSDVINQENLPKMIGKNTYGRVFRRNEYTVEFKNLLLLSFPPNGACLHVIDSSRPAFTNMEDPLIWLLAPNSRIELIDVHAEPKTPPLEIFGNEPNHTWCYYFQKASLALQQGDFEKIVQYGEEVKKYNLSPADVAEWLPFYEGFARANRTDLANELGALLRTSDTFLQSYCSVVMQDIPGEGIERYIVENVCTQFIRPSN